MYMGSVMLGIHIYTIYTAEPLVPGLGPFEFEIVVVKLIGHKSSGSEEIPPELVKVGVETL
jgi:hypothetical protein